MKLEDYIVEAIIGKTSYTRKLRLPKDPVENRIVEWLDAKGFKRLDRIDNPYKLINNGLYVRKKLYCISDTGARRAIFIYDLNSGYIIRLDDVKEHRQIVIDNGIWPLEKYMKYNDLIDLLEKNN